MNDYNCYEMICSMKRIAKQYYFGKEYYEKLHIIAEDIVKKKYRVAFIGEFNRGKSSLINALLGTDILPMDILPMTATVIRVVYGTTKNVDIHFKDGHIEPQTLEGLINFATKQDPKKTKMAASIDEIVVNFPSILFSNHVEILDTPGLNEAEMMSERTLQILNTIDAAVVVISAKIPISQTEQDLILHLIEQKEIRHLIFAITFIDKFDTENEKEKSLNFIYKRLSEYLLKLAMERFKGNNKLIDKAKKILFHPDVFGVSAMQARLALKKDDYSLLQKSGFLNFKEELMAILTKAQKEDILTKTLQNAEWIITQLTIWKEKEENLLFEKLRYISEREKIIVNYQSELKGRLLELLLEMDNSLETKGLSGLKGLDFHWEIPLQKLFILQLSKVSSQNNNHYVIVQLINEAKNKAFDIMEVNRVTLQNSVDLCMENVEKKFFNLLKKIDLNQSDQNDLKDNLAKFHKDTHFPVFTWKNEPIPPNVNLKNFNIMPFINETIHYSIQDFGKKINLYIGKWRLLLFKVANNEPKNLDDIKLSLIKKKKAIENKLAALPFVYEQHIDMLNKVCQELNVNTYI